MTTQISQKIVDQQVKRINEPSSPVITNIIREEVLLSSTYKTKNLEGIGFYITISDVITLEGVKRPYEFFVNTKEVEYYAYWMTIARLISAFLRTGQDYKFIAAELQQVFDPKGGYFKKGVLHPSFIAEIGMILEKHFDSIDRFNAGR
jgi:hypothetical protein